jgi:hypothetical protein
LHQIEPAAPAPGHKWLEECVLVHELRTSE